MECPNCGEGLVLVYEHNTMLGECVIQDQFSACLCGELVGKTFYSTISKEYMLYDDVRFWGKSN